MINYDDLLVINYEPKTTKADLLISLKTASVCLQASLQVLLPLWYP